MPKDEIGEVSIYSDGAARGNPGPAGIGAVICNRQGKVLKEISNYIGVATNNIAEYQALIAALKETEAKKAKALRIFSDSQLLVRQLNGLYKVKNQKLRLLHTEVLKLVSGKKIVIEHIRRGENQLADNLANQAIDLHLSGIN
jgi:ribonuclease HI